MSWPLVALAPVPTMRSQKARPEGATVSEHGGETGGTSTAAIAEGARRRAVGSRISRERRKPARAAEPSRRLTAMREGLGLVGGGNEVEVLVMEREWEYLVVVLGRRSRRVEGEGEEAIMAPKSKLQPKVMYRRLDKHHLPARRYNGSPRTEKFKMGRLGQLAI